MNLTAWYDTVNNMSAALIAGATGHTQEARTALAAAWASLDGAFPLHTAEHASLHLLLVRTGETVAEMSEAMA